MESSLSQQVIGPQGLASIITKFFGNNFHFWKFKMQILLEEREFWGIVSRIEVKIATNFTNWEKKDRKAKTFIMMGLYDSLLQNVIGAKITKKT
jgi:hypothetical protein